MNEQITYQGGEYIDFGVQYAYVLGRSSIDFILGITDEKEILLKLGVGSCDTHSLGYCEDIEIPNELDVEETFDWGEWAFQARCKLNDQGFLI